MDQSHLLFALGRCWSERSEADVDARHGSLGERDTMVWGAITLCLDLVSALFVLFLV